MKTLNAAGRALLALAFASCLAVPALAGDGDPVPAPSGEAKPAPATDAKPEARPEAKKGEDFCAAKQGPCLQEDGSCATDCPGAKKEPTDLDLVVVAALEGDGAPAKAVLASVAEEARAKVEESRKAVFDFLVKARKEMALLEKEMESACAEAKAEGKEVSCGVKAALAEDARAIHGKIREKVAAFAKTIEAQIPAEKVKTLAAEVKRAGDVAASLRIKVMEAVEKAMGAEECPESKCGEKKAGECDGEKKPVQ